MKIFTVLFFQLKNLVVYCELKNKNVRENARNFLQKCSIFGPPEIIRKLADIVLKHYYYFQ